MISLIANTGIQFHTLDIEIDKKNTHKVYFREWDEFEAAEPSSKKKHLELAHYFSTYDVWVSKKDLSDYGYYVNQLIDKEWEEIKKLENSNQKLQKKADSVPILKEEINIKESNLSMLETEIDALNNKNLKLNTDYNAVKAKLESKEEDLKKSNKQRNDLYSDKTEAESDRDEAMKQKNFIESSLNELFKIYDAPFEEVLTQTSLDRVIMDLKTLNKTPGLNKRNSRLETIKSAKSYFTAKYCLDKKYNSAEINNSLVQLQSISLNSESLNKLKSNLSNYNTKCKKIKLFIKEIEKLNVDSGRKENDGSKNRKSQKMLGLLSSKLIEYGFDEKSYPYLNEKIQELKEAIFDDCNNSVLDFLGKL